MALPACAAPYPPDAHLQSATPHPAVARIVVPEDGATSYGSGVLVDVRDDFGLVITNWHVVRDAAGTVEVIMPGGFTSKARPLKVDEDWDLAALVTWRPQAAPVTIATRAPQPGEQLTICGYGPGLYRSATGRCTQYYSPRVDLPQHMVELDVEARQGDSGGPIFNERGELAGVLFGAGQGTTLGSFGGRVDNFLASLAPGIGAGGQPSTDAGREFALASTEASTTPTAPVTSERATVPTATWRSGERLASEFAPRAASANGESPASAAAAASIWSPAPPVDTVPVAGPTHRGIDLVDLVKSALAAVGLVAIVVQLLRLVR